MIIHLGSMTGDVMRKIIGILSLIWFVCIISPSPIHRASDCEYGAVQAWVRTSDGSWQNATAHPVLRRGESFEIKIIVMTKTVLNVFYIKLHEFGEPVYEIIKGPSVMEQFLEIRAPALQNRTQSYLWKMRVRVNTSWVNGYAPLEVYVQFNRNDFDDVHVNFDVMTAYIIDELWEKYEQPMFADKLQSEQENQPGISQMYLLGNILLLFFISIFFHVQRHNCHLVKSYKGSWYMS